MNKNYETAISRITELRAAAAVLGYKAYVAECDDVLACDNWDDLDMDVCRKVSKYLGRMYLVTENLSESEVYQVIDTRYRLDAAYAMYGVVEDIRKANQ